MSAEYEYNFMPTGCQCENESCPCTYRALHKPGVFGCKCAPVAVASWYRRSWPLTVFAWSASIALSAFLLGAVGFFLYHLISAIIGGDLNPLVQQ